MVSRLRLTHNSPPELFLDRLPKSTREAFLRCTKLPLFARSGWYLAGGTALALHAGHRQSVDLDFFTPQKSFRDLAVERALLATHAWRTTYREQGTIFGTLLDARMSLIAYPFFTPSQKKFRYGTVKILTPGDIAAMKIIAISQRGRKRDFVDLYWYCRNHEPLAEILSRAVTQYPGQERNMGHIIKSLAYFADAEHDPMPKLFFKATWKEVKTFFQREAVRMAREFLGVR